MLIETPFNCCPWLETAAIFIPLMEVFAFTSKPTNEEILSPCMKQFVLAESGKKELDMLG
jgi:hypothetical protein